MSVQPALNQPIPPGGDWWNLGASKALRNLLLLSVIAVFFVFAMANVTFGKDEYKNVSSNETTKGLQFKWYDIIGVETSSSITTDNAIQTGVPIGFTFYHSETTYTKINISENGFLWLGGETVVEGNQIMGQSGGAASDVVHVIAPLWDEYDITKNTSGRIYYQTLGKSPRRYFVVTWSEMAHKYSTPGDTVTFQAVLFENSSAILFNYLDASFGNASVDFGINATVGVENSTFGGTNFSVNSSSLKSNMSILFYFNDSTTRGLAASTRERSCYIPFDGMAIANNTTLCPGVFRINDSGNDAVITLNVGIEDIAVDCDNTEIVGNLTNGDQITGNEGINSNRNDGGTIRGCTLSNYSYNLRVIGGERVTLLENWLLSGYTGLRVEGPGNATSVNLSISNNTFANNTLGLYLDQMQTVNVSGNTFRDNTQFHISHSASNSTFWRNNFIGLPSGSVPYQSAGQNNSLNYSTEGNYWSTYDQEAEGCINAAAPFDQCDSPLPRSNLSQTIENITDFYPWVHQIDTNCTTPAENLTITWTQSLCGGEYRINDSAGQGVIFLPGTGLVLSCNNTILIGNSTVGSEGIRVTGYNMTLRGCTLRGYDTGINLRLGITNVTIINNSLINTSSGIYAQYLNNSVIRKNLFLNNTGTSSTGGGLVITANSVNNSILNNTFIGNSYGIHFEAASGQLLLNQIISNNTFWNHTVNAIYNTFSNTNGSIVHNNRFFNTSGIAIWSFGASMNFTNNSFTNNAGAMLFSGSNGTNNFVYYNNFTNNSRTNSFGSFEVSSAYVANYFNTSVGGVAQGNFWYDIFTNSLRIFDVDVNAFGDSGPHYPYNDSNGGNVTGNVTDWGPMLIDSDGDGDPDNVDCSPNNNLTLNPRNMTIRNNTAVTFCNGTFSFLSINLSGYNELVTCNNTRFVGQYEGSLFQLLDVANGVSNLTLRNCFVSNYSIFVDFGVAGSNLTRSNIRVLNNTLVNMSHVGASGVGAIGIRFQAANYSDVVIANNTMSSFRQFVYSDPVYGIQFAVDTVGQFASNVSIFGNDIRDIACAGDCLVAGIAVQVGQSFGSSNISVFNNTVGFSECTGSGCELVGILDGLNASKRIFNNTVVRLSSSYFAVGVIVANWNGTNISENTFANISGTRLGAGVYNLFSESYGSGVLVERNTFSNVTIGVQFDRESNHTIQNNTFRNVSTAVFLNASNYSRVFGNVITHSTRGILVFGARNDLVGENNLTNMSLFGIVSNSSDFIRYENNTISVGPRGIDVNNGTNITIGWNVFFDVALNLTVGVRNTTVRNNSFAGNSTLFLGRQNVTDNVIYHNNFSGNGIKAQALSSGNQFNISVAGVVQGNFWSDIASVPLLIFDANLDGFGDAGPNYPYNQTNGGNVSVNVTDFGPILSDADRDGEQDATDCNDNDNSVLSPYDGLRIVRNTTLCSGTYAVADAAGDGVILMNSTNHVNLWCNATVIAGTGAGTQYGIQIRNRTNVSVRACTLLSYTYAIYLGSVNDSLILNNTLRNNSINGVLAENVNTTVFRQNVFSNNSVGISYLSVQNSSIVNNTFRENRNGIDFSGGRLFNNTVANNTFVNHSSIFFNISATLTNDSVVSNNVFVNSSFTAIESGGSGISYLNNTFIAVPVGISFVGLGVSNVVTFNNFSNVTVGVDLRGSNFSNFSYNVVNGSLFDISLGLGSFNNSFFINHLYGRGMNDSMKNNSFCVNVSGSSVLEGNFYINTTNVSLRGWNECGPVNITRPNGGDFFKNTVSGLWKKQSAFLPITYFILLSNRSGANFSVFNVTTVTNVTIDSSALAEGSYAMRVVPFDTQVNGTYVTADRNFSIDKTAPFTFDNVSSDALFWWVDENVSVLLNATDNLSGVNFSAYCAQSVYNATLCDSNTLLYNLVFGNFTPVVNISCAGNSVCQMVLRYRSGDNLGNNESNRSSLQVNIVMGSYIFNSSLNNSNVSNGSTVISSNLSNSIIDGCFVQNSTVVNSTLRLDSGFGTPCRVINSTVLNSALVSSRVIGSWVDPSNFTDSVVIDSNISDGRVEFSTIKNGSFCAGGFYAFGGVILNDILSGGQIAYGGSLYFGPLFIDDICRGLPHVNITLPVPGSVVNGTFNVTFQSTENRSLRISIDGGNFTPVTTNNTFLWNTTNLSEGGHLLQVRDVDSTGTFIYSSIVPVTVDNTPDSVTIIKPLSGTTVSGDFIIEATAADWVSRVEFIVRNTTGSYSPQGGSGSLFDSNGVDGWSANWSSSLFKDGGLYNVTVIASTRCFFIFNCYNASDTEVDVRVNNLAPNSPASFTIQQTPFDSDGFLELNWSTVVNDDISYYRVYRSIGPNFTITSGFLVKNVSANFTNDTVTDGNYFYKITAVDLGGLESGASNEVNVTVDTRGPVGSLSLVPLVVRDGARFLMKYVGVESSLNVSVNTSLVDSNGVVVQLNDTDLNGVYEANYTITESNTRDDGNYSLTAVIRDSARNVLNTSATIILDNSNPTGSITIIGINGSKITGSPNVILNLSFNDTNNLAGCRFTNDNVSLLNFSSLEPCLSTKSWILSTNEGNKTVFAEFLDAAGNSLIVNDSIEYHFVQDYTAPTKPIVYDGSAGDDVDWWNDNTSLSAYWFNSTEDMSEIYYKYRIRINATIINGTLTNSSGCIPADCNFTDVGRDTAVTRTNLSLTEGTNYSFEIETFNPFNISAGSAYSDGVTIDITVPDLPIINSSTHAINTSTANNSPAFNWSAVDVLGGAVRSGVTGYSWILDTHPGSAPDDVLEDRYKEPVSVPKNNGFSQLLKDNSTGLAYAVFTEVETNVTVNDTFKVRVQLAEIPQDYRDRMEVRVYAIRKAETDGATAFTYNDTAALISNIANISRDIQYAEDLHDAEFYSADLNINGTFNGTGDAIYVVVEGWAQDDDNRGNLTLAGSNALSEIDNSTRNFICAEGASCTENTSNLDFAVDIKKVSAGDMHTTTYTDLADGTYYFHVKAKDLAGNFGGTSHYKIVISRVGSAQPFILSPTTGQLFESTPINVIVSVDQNASVFVVALHPDGSNSTSGTALVNATTHTFTGIVLENGTNEIYAQANGTNGASVKSSSVFVIFSTSLVPSTNKTLLVTYNVGGSSTTHMAYVTSATDAIGLASENDVATVSGAGSLSVRSDTSTIPTKIFMTTQLFNPTAIEEDLGDNDFLDRINPMFGFTRKNDKFVVRSELRYEDLYIGGERAVPSGTYRLTMRNNGLTADGRVNITVTIT